MKNEKFTLLYNCDLWVYLSKNPNHSYNFELINFRNRCRVGEYKLKYGNKKILIWEFNEYFESDWLATEILIYSDNILVHSTKILIYSNNILVHSTKILIYSDNILVHSTKILIDSTNILVLSTKTLIQFVFWMYLYQNKHHKNCLEIYI